MITETVTIHRCWTGAVMFTADVEAGLSTAGLKLGAAIKIAIKAGVSLGEADLCGAYLRGADLGGADMSGAYLRGADLRGAYLRGACLNEVISLLDCGTPYSWRIVVVRHDDGVRIAAGCRWFTFAEAVAHWRDRADRKLMPPLLEYIRAICTINGWPLGDDGGKK